MEPKIPNGLLNFVGFAAKDFEESYAKPTGSEVVTTEGWVDHARLGLSAMQSSFPDDQRVGHERAQP
jgi:hypothetical protein